MLRTVNGEISADDVVGAVLPHEHLAMHYEGMEPDAGVSRADLVITELRQLRTGGQLGLIMELSCHGLGRDATGIKRISDDAGLHVIAATGYYWGKFHSAETAGSDIDALTERLVDEIEAGMDGTMIRPGVIGEVGSDGDWPSPAEERCLRASARAAVSSGLAMCTHANLGPGGLGQLEILTSEGLTPDRISIGHQDLLDDPDVHRQLAAAGAYVAFDTIGKEAYQSDDVRLRNILKLIEAGHADRILLSTDVSRDRYLTRPSGAYGYLFNAFLPRLERAGVDADTIVLMTRHNPLRLLQAGQALG
jgi:phosphotriesterase-related protein